MSDALTSPHRPRRSIIELARTRGYTVEETPVSVHDAMEVRCNLGPDKMLPSCL